MIEVKGLEKAYDQVNAVSNVSFTVHKGEIVGLLGHNGAGKTTVMKMVTGFLEPTQGNVSVGGVDVLTDPLGVQKQIGYLPESAPLYPEMLVQEYLVMMANLRGIPAEKVETAVSEAAGATGLGDKLMSPISTLSKGYRQRVGLAQAIVHRPEVLILDEPTSGLDPVQIIEIRRLILELAKSSTVILSTHILQEVEAVCDRVLILINGSLVADAPLKELLQSDQLTVSLPESTPDVEGTLSAAEEIKTVTSTGRDPRLDGYATYRIQAQGDRPLGPAVGRVAKDQGWMLGGLVPDTPNLEAVFNKLMDDHVAARRPQEASV